MSTHAADAIKARWALVKTAEMRWKAQTLPTLVTAEQIPLFDMAFKKAMLELAPRRQSGLVEFQRILARRAKP